LNRIRVGSRESTLALWQTNWVIERLSRSNPGLQFEVVHIKTEGDKMPDAPLAKIGGRGVFVKELESALLDGRIDIAVHSLKDMPSLTPESLAIAAVTEREDARDVLVSRGKMPLSDLPFGAKVGTSSVRRAAQMKYLRPDVQILELRGNLETRLRKAEGGDYDAVILAAAGIKRLGLEDRIAEHLPTEQFLPAVGQGALAVEIRADEGEIQSIVVPVTHRPTQLAVLAERSFLRVVGGGCSAPVAAYGRLEGNRLILDGMIASLDGQIMIKDRLEGEPARAISLGEEMAGRLLERGGRDILTNL